MPYIPTKKTKKTPAPKINKPHRWTNGRDFETELKAFANAFPDPSDRTVSNYATWPTKKYDRHFKAYGGFYKAMENFGIQYIKPRSPVDTLTALKYFLAIHQEKQQEIRGQVNAERRPSISDYKRLRPVIDALIGYNGPSYHYYSRRFFGWTAFTKKFQQCCNGQVTFDQLIDSVRLAPPEAGIPAALRYDILVLAGGVCQLCEEKPPTQIDHFVPKAMGGKTVRSNLRALCGDCNSAKSDKPLEFLVECLKLIPINQELLDLSEELRRDARLKRKKARLRALGLCSS